MAIKQHDDKNRTLHFQVKYHDKNGDDHRRIINWFQRLYDAGWDDRKIGDVLFGDIVKNRVNENHEYLILNKNDIDSLREMIDNTVEIQKQMMMMLHHINQHHFIDEEQYG